MPVAVTVGPVAPPGTLAAHTPNGEGHWHTLADHLDAVAGLAAQFGMWLGLDEVAYWAGLWHDIGKASCVFQEYLECAATDPGEARRRYRSRDHKHAGALLALDTKLPAAAFAIMGHHGGIPDATTIRKIVRTERLADHADLIERVAAALDTDIRPNLPVRTEPTDGLLGQEMLTRFLTSCLVDADYLDTGRHFNPEQHRARRSATLEEVHGRFTRRHTRMLAGSDRTPVNIERTLWADAATARAATSTPGVYRLTGPTGIGKTVGGMAAALAHASRWGQRSVIVATPYMAVTDQTAQVLRGLCDPTEPDAPPAVLEHHSTALDTHDNSWDRLASENWDAPVVVTTTVQLLESLFTNRPGQLRKLHRLSNAVIIIDEPQTIPAGVLEPVIDALNWLTEHAGTTVILQTATQPKFERIGVWADRTIPDWGTPVASPVMRRVTWNMHPIPVTHQDIADRINAAGHNQVLCVVNTIRDALTIHAASPPGTLYLTTRLTQTHRRAVLEEVRERLNGGQPCRLIATQLVEAGVDLDFPEVHRAIGPLTSLAQAAGRCNRNGHLPTGQMHLFELEAGQTPGGEYAAGTAATRNIAATYQDRFNPEDPEQLSAWYDLVYGTGATSTQQFDINDTQTHRRNFRFSEVAKLRLIPQATVPVVVRWGSDDDLVELYRIVERVETGRVLTRTEWRFLGRMSVTVPASHLERHPEWFTTIRVANGPSDQTGIPMWNGVYSPDTGITFDDR